MWTWLVRLWDYLRRLIMSNGGIVNGNGGRRTNPYPTKRSRRTGTRRSAESSRRSCCELLEGDNLRQFQGSGRNMYLNRPPHQVQRGGVARAHDGRHAGDSRRTSRAITGSQAVLLYVVCPPF